jgi:hypothetical protein
MVESPSRIVIFIDTTCYLTGRLLLEARHLRRSQAVGASLFNPALCFGAAAVKSLMLVTSSSIDSLSSSCKFFLLSSKPSDKYLLTLQQVFSLPTTRRYLDPKPNPSEPLSLNYNIRG